MHTHTHMYIHMYTCRCTCPSCRAPICIYLHIFMQPYLLTHHACTHVHMHLYVCVCVFRCYWRPFLASFTHQYCNRSLFLIIYLSHRSLDVSSIFEPYQPDLLLISHHQPILAAFARHKLSIQDAHQPSQADDPAINHCYPDCSPGHSPHIHYDHHHYTIEPLRPEKKHQKHQKHAINKSNC